MLVVLWFLLLKQQHLIFPASAMSGLASGGCPAWAHCHAQGEPARGLSFLSADVSCLYVGWFYFNCDK